MPILRDITLGQYYPGNSFLHRLDPRSKLLTSLISMTSLLFVFNKEVLFVTVLFCLAGVAVSGVPGRVIFGNIKPFKWLCIITFLIHALSGAGQTLITIPGIGLAITEQGLTAGGAYVVRLVFLIVLAALFTLTTTPTDLTDGLAKLLSPLRRCKVPVHEFALMMTLTLRFVPILLREAERIRNAQLSRGASLEGRLLERVRNLIPMLVPLFVSAIRRAEELAVAMESRNYITGSVRTAFRKLAFRKDDAVLCLVTVLFVGIVSAVR